MNNREFFGYSSFRAFCLFNLEDFLSLTSFGSLVWVWFVLIFLTDNTDEELVLYQEHYFFTVLSLGRQQSIH